MSNEPLSEPKKLSIWLPLLFSLILVAGMLIGTRMQYNPPTVAAIGVAKTAIQDMPQNSLGQGKLEELIRYIEAKYVDDVNKDDLVREAIDNILHHLDPHSNYISAEQLKSVNEQLDGSFDGIGIEFVVVEDTVMVVATVPGGPASGAGILPGDKFVEIEDSLTVGKNVTYEGILERLKGEKGTKIQVGIRRGHEKKLRHFTLTRDKIPVHSVDVAYMLDKGTGYIKLTRFSANTYEEFMKALEDLVENQKMKHLVLDLRQNPGGYLQEATNVLSQLFEEKDRLFVYTEGSNSNRSDYKSTGRNFYEIGNIAVLTDEGSASASEIIAGAIQDWDRGVVVGRRTYGKGLVQEQYRLRDGSAIRLTVARYFTPSGRCIQKPYNGRDDYDLDLSDRIESGELFDEDKIEVEDTTKYFTTGGRVVYGGGGIWPDVFVPLDSILLNSYYIQLHQHLAPFSFRYKEENEAALKAMGLDGFLKNFNVGDGLANQFLAFAVQHGGKRSESQWRKVKNNIKQMLKANIARQLWAEQGYFMALNQNDPAVLNAMKLMLKEKPLALKKK